MTDNVVLEDADGAEFQVDGRLASHLTATYVAKAPAPSGVKATDEANVQPLLTAAQNAGGGVVHLAPSPLGVAYLMDLTTALSNVNPVIEGNGAKWDGSMVWRGNTAAFTKGGIYDVEFTGTRSAGVAVMEFRGAVSVKWDRIKFSGTADIGILFHNQSSGQFTEMCSGVADFGQNIKTKVVYRVASGNPSFHGCGCDEGTTMNQVSTSTTPEVSIEAGAEPYNCPMSVTFWATNAQPLIKHLGLSSSSFYGDLKVELLPSQAKAVIVDTASTSNLPYAGSVSRRGKLVQLGKLVQGEEVITTTSVAQVKRGGAETKFRISGNVNVVGPDGTAEWVPTTRTNRAKNPVAGDGTVNASGYSGATVASATDSALGSTKLWTVTTTDAAQTQGFIYLQSASDLAQGQIKTVAMDVLSPVDIILYAGGRFGLSGSPGIAEVGEVGSTGDVEYVAANVVTRIRRIVVVPPPNAAGTITAEGLYFRANTTGDMPANGTVFKVGNITIEDGTVVGSKFSGESGGTWTGAANQSTTIAYPSQPNIPSAEVAYTPTLTNVTLGNGELAAYYSKVGKRVTGSIYFKYGSTSAVTDVIRVSLPTDAPIVAGSKRRFSGDGWMNDFSISQRFVARTLPNGTTAFDIHGVGGGAGGYHIQIATSATAPFTWATDDELLVSFAYETV